MVRLRKATDHFARQTEVDELDPLVGVACAEIGVEIGDEPAGVSVAVAEEDDSLGVLQKEVIGMCDGRHQ